MDSARLDVLNAVEAGQISAREAARLLDALAGRPQQAHPALRLRVTDLATGRVPVDARLPLEVLEAGAELELRLDALWGLAGAIDAAGVLAAVKAGGRGLLAEATDETLGRRVEVLAEED